MAILSKQQLIDYCKRKLGDPIMQINVTTDQIDDCFEQTIETWWHFHPDGLEKMYLKHQITGTQVTVANSTGFGINNNIDNAKGTTSKVLTVNGNILLIDKQSEPNRIAVGDTISNGTVSSLVTAVLIGDMDNSWIPVSDFVYGVTRIFPYSSGAGTSRNLFDLQYQLRLNNIFDLSSTTLAYYAEVMTHVQMLDTMLNGTPQFRFNRLQNKLFLDTLWGNSIKVGDYVLIDCYRAMDPNEYNRVYGEPWVRKFLIACIKQQWGMNLKKYQGVQLIGGVTIDGQSMYDEGTEEMQSLTDEVINNGAPLEWFTG